MRYSARKASAFVGALSVCISGTVLAQSAHEPEDTAIRGVIAAGQQAVVTVGLSARLADVPYEMGDRFEEGAVLLQFDCEKMTAEWEALKASRRSLAKTQKTNLEMFEHGAAGSLDVEKGRAEMERAAAEANAKKAQLSDCTVRAPYAGSVSERYVDPFETPAPGAPLLKIIDGGPLEIQLIVPSSSIVKARIGAPLLFEVTETGAVYEAVVHRIGVAIDPVSQTLDVVAQFTEETPGVMAGMSGVVRFLAAEGP